MTTAELKGVLLDADTLDRGDIDFSVLKEQIPSLTIHQNTTGTTLDESLRDAQIVLTNKVVLTRETLEKHPQIRLICVLATGTNNIDMEAAKTLGIIVKNVVAYGTPSVVQHVYGLILNLARSQVLYLRAVQDGDWGRQDKFCLLDYPITDLTGKTLGIIGYGELGQGVANAASAFGLNVMVAERSGSPPREGRSSIDMVFSKSDILSLHCPLTADTEQLINKKTLQIMKSGAWLINTARGGLVNEADLAWALDNDVIAGAALDVLNSEPPALGNPLLERPRDNLLITPHIAWATSMARQKVIELTAQNIKEFLLQRGQ